VGAEPNLERIQVKAQDRGNPSFVWRAGQERRLNLVRQHVSLEGKSVLDAGCGVGMYVAAFARAGAIAYGVDIEADRVKMAQSLAARIVAGSVEALPFAGEAFDVVFSHEVIEHVGDDVAAIREAARTVRPGGYVVVYAPNRWYPFETHGIQWRGAYHFGNYPLVNYLPHAWRNRLVPHVRAYTRRQIRALFAGTPLRIIVHTQIYPGFDNIVARRPALGRLLRVVLYALEHTPLRAFGLSHFIVAVHE
jgi:2-polyprenyl-3-methyl-5-hydroxy-6-metoxy-1,4-benzoquinol methylase